ncbi:hypothetical protein AVEN_133102-1 [Araneus ventricosus]|uniref:Uncharacterized protein n=1 Tax=Araneus ventricosus TaxID=182803 RepID=A0A4Y2G138_ARAVE|nr:hypothetical protein AVEN_133102-1 [Araneus ventricosus]
MEPSALLHTQWGSLQKRRKKINQMECTAYPSSLNHMEHALDTHGRRMSERNPLPISKNQNCENLPQIFLDNFAMNMRNQCYAGIRMRGERIPVLRFIKETVIKLLWRLVAGDWEANCELLRMTYTALIQRVLEYGYQIYQWPLKANLNKLEKYNSTDSNNPRVSRSCCPKAVYCLR